MKLLAFSGRTAKEIIRDPLNLAFGIGLPNVLLLLLSAIQANVPVSIFEIGNLTPGIAVFGLSFMTLFSAVLISKDRESAMFQRLFSTPLTASDFIFGYMLPILPIAVLQSMVCFIVAVFLGLPVTVRILYCILLVLPISLFFIALGLLCGSILNSKQVGGICGALVTNLTAWLSGAWFDLELVGGTFRKIANLLPFVHAVETEKAVLSGQYSNIFPHIYWVIGYSAVITAAAVLVFIRQIKKQ